MCATRRIQNLLNPSFINKFQIDILVPCAYCLDVHAFAEPGISRVFC